MQAQDVLHTFGELIVSLRQAGTLAEKLALIGSSSEEKTIWSLILDPKLTWGLSTIPTGKPLSREVKDQWKAASFSKVLGLLHDLQTRALTGNSASESVRAVWQVLQTDEAKSAWLAIIEKRTSCGVNLSTVQKKHPGLIDVFRVMRAETWDEKKVDAIFDKHGFAWAQAKYDGERRIAIVKDGEASLLTRDGNLDRVHQRYADELANYLPDGVYDSELYMVAGFQKLSKQTRTNTTKGEVKALDLNEGLVIILFDHLTHEEWADRKCLRTLEGRMAVLEDCKATCRSKYIYFVVSTRVESQKEIDDLYDEYVKAGLEGLILKKPKGSYEWKKSSNWIKLKPQETLDLQIVGFVAADVVPGSNSPHSLGKIIVAYDGGTVKVGPGNLTFEERDEIWENRDSYIGKIIEVKYQNKTETGSLRSPRAVRMRHDRNTPEDVG